MSNVEEIKKALEDVTPDRIERIWWFLHIMSQSSGTADASDDKWNWINAFCHDYEDDTFNRAKNLGFIRVTHDTDMDASYAAMTDAGNAFIAYFDKAPSASDLTTLEALQRENERLQAEIGRTERNRDMWKGQVERQAKQIEDFRSETKRLQVGVHVETLPRAHLIRVFAEDMNERNWDDKRLYIKQQAERITAALASAGEEHHAE